jgi:hypothetical protein
MNHEFYQIMVGAPTISLHDWKQLSRWSIDYSCLSKEEISEGHRILDSEYEEFCNHVVWKYGELIVGGKVDDGKAKEMIRKQQSSTNFLLKSFQGKKLEPWVEIRLPHNLTEQDFDKLLLGSGPAAYQFPALRTWLSRMVEHPKLQPSGEHSYPYKLHEIQIEAAGWFCQNEDSKHAKLRFMKIQAKVGTDELGDKNTERTAVFLQSRSVALLVWDCCIRAFSARLT